MQRKLGKDYLLWGLFALLAVTTVWTKKELVWLFLLAGSIALFVKAPPKFRTNSTKVAALSPGLLSGLAAAAFLGARWSAVFFFLNAGPTFFWRRPGPAPFAYARAVSPDDYQTRWPPF